MRKSTFVAIAAMLTAAPAFGQSSGQPPGTTAPAAAPHHTAPAAHPAQAKPATPETRSAAALALSYEPTYDEGSAQRIREAALSYGDIAVRGG